jgi:hypothetical protein
MKLAFALSFATVVLGTGVSNGRGGILNTSHCYSGPNKQERAPGSGIVWSGTVMDVTCYAAGEKVGQDKIDLWYFTVYGCWLPHAVFNQANGPIMGLPHC